MLNWRVVDDIGTISPAQWQVLDTQGNPFLSYAFLSGLEKFGCLKNQNWQPCHIVIEENNELLGFMPLYIKHDSYGEFVFDWAWADAYQQAGRNYYPKLISAIPFTPVGGTRLLINKSQDKETIKQALLNAALTLMDEKLYSSVHILFPEKDDLDVLTDSAGLKRITIQYHWLNKDYRDFQDFTDSLTSKKRKKIIKERREIKKSGVEIERLNGDEISSEQWNAFYQFYCRTFYSKGGEPRLTLDFFKSLGKALPEQTLLVMAKMDQAYIAGAFAMSDLNTLYGRHWGCNQYLPNLHFELCYYQTIEYTIERQLERLDAGVQGEHKLARGFHPIAMPSVHWIREEDFRNAIANYLDRETTMMQEHIEMLESHLPFKLE
jgi:predicted N-acyltransferase